MPKTVDMGAVRAVYQKWLDGSLSEEDTLFQIGDLLGNASHSPKAGEPASGPESKE